MRIGSVFSGYGGLDMACEAAFGATTAWVSDIDPGACTILAHRYPDLPNLGDITAVDWEAVKPVDVLCGGFPCQDVSHAGKRAGLRPDTRSGLWSQMAYAVSILRPRYVVAENVRGLLSARAASDVEPCPWCLGGAADGEPDLRALGAVLGDLAELGYDASWVGLRASDVGAPHGRFRVFIVATDTASEPRRVGHGDDVRPRGGAVGRAPHAGQRRALAYAGSSRTGRDGRAVPRALATSGRARLDVPSSVDGRDGAIADTTSDGRHEGWTEPTRLVRGPDAAECGDAAADADHGAHDGERPRAGSRVGASVAWGPYEPAVRRWEHVTGRVAPAPTETSSKGSQRLSPRFVEWMMGLPVGWVTAVPGLGRNAQLKALGNGVVPQQAYAALVQMLTAEIAA